MLDFEKADAIYGGLVFPSKLETPRGSIEGLGITKRELFAAMALQAYIAGRSDLHGAPPPITAAERAVEYADALLKELDK